MSHKETKDPNPQETIEEVLHPSRTKLGRKRSTDIPKEEERSISTRLSVHEFEKVKKVAKETNMTTSDLLRECVGRLSAKDGYLAIRYPKVPGITQITKDEAKDLLKQLIDQYIR